MVERRHEPHTIMAPIVAAGGLTVPIPRSSLAVLLGNLAPVNIGRLLIAGVVPVLPKAIFHVAVIAAMVKPGSDATLSYEVDETPVGCRLLAAAFGVFAVPILATIHRKLTWTTISESQMRSLSTTIVRLIIMDLARFSQPLVFSGAGHRVGDAGYWACSWA